MADRDEWVLLVECNDIAELHTLRATLEARGVPCRILGEHTHGVFGTLQGAAVRSRVLVPRQALRVARALAEDIVGPFDERPEPEDAALEASPFRTSAADDDEDDDDDDDDDDDEDDDDAPPRGALARQRHAYRAAVRPRSYATLLLIVLIGGPLLGLSHVYVRRMARATLLALASLCAFAAWLTGAAWALPVLVTVPILDVLGGVLGVAAERRRVAALPAATQKPELPAA
jgi:hypothetical protein